MIRILKPFLCVSSLFFILAGCGQEVSNDTFSKIGVFLYTDIEEDQDKKVRINGKTNLPNGMDLMIGVRNDSEYFAQDKVRVSNGLFQSGLFSNSGDGLVGSYMVEVTSPIFEVQSSEVQKNSRKGLC